MPTVRLIISEGINECLDSCSNLYLQHSAQQSLYVCRLKYKPATFDSQPPFFLFSTAYRNEDRNPFVLLRVIIVPASSYFSSFSFFCLPRLSIAWEEEQFSASSEQCLIYIHTLVRTCVLRVRERKVKASYIPYARWRSLNSTDFYT